MLQQPAPVRLRSTENIYPKPIRPFDAKLLVIKLEAARIQQLIAKKQEADGQGPTDDTATTQLLPGATRPKVARRTTDDSVTQRRTALRKQEEEFAAKQQAARHKLSGPPTPTTAEHPLLEMTTLGGPTGKRASYIPRNAAKHFAATTTPLQPEVTQDLKRARSTKERGKPDFHRASMPVLNPKQVSAGLGMGMSESGIAAAAAAADSTKTSKHLSVPVANKKASNRHSRVVVPAENRRSLDLPGPDEHTMSGYKPGDAAKRAAERRRSQIISPQAKLTTVTNGAGAVTQHREYSLSFADPKHDSAIADDHDTSAALNELSHFNGQQLQRPALKPHDRANWAQESQCGDDVLHHHHLRSHFGRRKSSKTAADREGARQALEGGVGNSKGSVRAAGPARHRSADYAPQALVGDAVRLIKQEEKVRRRQSIVGFFKRL